MSEFPAKLDQLNIILNPRTYNEKLLTKALTIVHNDVISCHQAFKTYTSQGLISGLISLCRFSTNHMILLLATSLLHSCCVSSELILEQYMNSNGLIYILAMISARDNSAYGSDVINHTMMIHEQALKFVVLLSSYPTYHQRLLSHGFLKKVIELAEIFRSESLHYNCCYEKICFSEEAQKVSKTLLQQNKFVGKVNPDQSSCSDKGSLSVLAMDLYNTSNQNKDINISKELIQMGLAWPDVQTIDTLVDEFKTEKIDKTVWCDIFVTKVVDAHCFWAHTNISAKSIIEKISCLIEDYIYSSDVCNLVDFSCGTRICFCLTNQSGKNQWMRGCILETESSGCLVLLVDFGYVVRVDNDQLFPLPQSANEIDHQAKLCVLEGVIAIPKHTEILRYSAEILCNLSQAGHVMRMRIHNDGGTRALLRLCKLPDKNIIMAAVAALSNLLLNFNIRAQLRTLGHLLLDLLKTHCEDNELLAKLLACLVNFILESSPNRKQVAINNGLLILCRVNQLPNTNDHNRSLVLKAMKNLIGDGWRLLDPINAPDVRGIIEEKIDTIKGCFDLSNMCGEDLLEEVRGRRAKRVLKQCEVLPDPTYVAMSMDDLAKKFSGIEYSDTDSRSDVYKTGTNTDIESSVCSVKPASLSGFEGYLYGEKIEQEEDECNAFIYESSTSGISNELISNTICAFLNTGKGGRILMGVKEDGLVLGINITRAKRDALRLGIDDAVDGFTPQLTPDRIEVKFAPVKVGATLDSLEQYEERYVVEIHIAKNSDKLYSTRRKRMLYRDGGKNTLLTMQQIRERTIKEQEERYQSEIRSLCLTLQDVKERLGPSQPP